MMEFIFWVIFTKIVSQVVIIAFIEKDCDYWKGLRLLKKIVIIEKDHDYWKRLWLLKKIAIIEKDCDNWKRFW